MNWPTFIFGACAGITVFVCFVLVLCAIWSRMTKRQRESNERVETQLARANTHGAALVEQLNGIGRGIQTLCEKEAK